MHSIYQYATNLIQPQPPIRAVDIKEEMRIDTAFRRIMSTPMSDDQRKQELAHLLRERASLMHHVPAYGLKGNVIFFNMKLIGLAPTPSCPAYNKMRVPTISLYHQIASNIVIVRLDESALQHIPKQMLEKMGDLSRKQVEFFWTAIDGRNFIREDRSINLCTHPWSHPFALNMDDVGHDVNMGIFPEVGFKPCQKPGAVAFHGMGPMRVYTHFEKGSMRYSPDNAHFEAIPGSPFGIFWAATEKEGRVALTKTLVIFDYEHPISKCLIDSIRDCGDLATHLKRLAQTKDAIGQSLTLPDHGFMQAFDKLPPAFQYGIYFEAWRLFDSPLGIHDDFGKASFKGELSLDEKFHCTHDQRKQGIANFAMKLENLLIDSQMDLTLNSQPLQKGDNVLRMMRCAQLFAEADAIPYNYIPYNSPLDRETRNRANDIEKKRVDDLKVPIEAEAMQLFSQFSKDEKESVFDAFCELIDCSREDDFGTKGFLNQTTPFSVKSRALLLAASRQSPQYGEPLIPAAPLEEMVPYNPTFDIALPQVPAFVETQCDFSVGLTPKQKSSLLNKISNLAFNDNFIELLPENRRIIVEELLNELPLPTDDLKDLKNSIYGKIYEYSTDSEKGGTDWGQIHIGDNLDVLVDVFQDVFENVP